MWNNFLGNSSSSGDIFTLQMKIFGIMADTQPRAVPSGHAVWGVGLRPAEIMGSNPTGGMDVRLLWVLYVVR